MSSLWRWRLLGLLPLLPTSALGLTGVLRAIETGFPPLVALLLVLTVGGWVAGLKAPLFGFPGGELFAQVLLAVSYFTTALFLAPVAGVPELFGAVLIFLICGEASATFGPLLARRLQVERALRRLPPMVPPPELGDLGGVGHRWFVRIGVVAGATFALSGVSIYAGGLLLLPSGSVLALGVLLVAIVAVLIALLSAGAELIEE